MPPKKAPTSTAHVASTGTAAVVAAPPPPPKPLLEPYVNLVNCGLSCFMNSTFQMLFHMPEVRDAILALPIPAGATNDNEALRNLQSIITSMNTNKGILNEIDIRDLYEHLYCLPETRFVRSTPDRGITQQDMSDFLTKCITDKYSAIFGDVNTPVLNKFKVDIREQKLACFQAGTTRENLLLGETEIRNVGEQNGKVVKEIARKEINELVIKLAILNKLDDTHSGDIQNILDNDTLEYEENTSIKGYKLPGDIKSQCMYKKISYIFHPTTKYVIIQLNRFDLMGNILNYPVKINKELFIENKALTCIGIVRKLGGAKGGHYTYIGKADNSNWYQFDDYNPNRRIQRLNENGDVYLNFPTIDERLRRPIQPELDGEGYVFVYEIRDIPDVDVPPEKARVAAATAVARAAIPDFRILPTLNPADICSDAHIREFITKRLNFIQERIPIAERIRNDAQRAMRDYIPKLTAYKMNRNSNLGGTINTNQRNINDPRIAALQTLIGEIRAKIAAAVSRQGNADPTIQYEPAVQEAEEYLNQIEGAQRLVLEAQRATKQIVNAAEKKLKTRKATRIQSLIRGRATRKRVDPQIKAAKAAKAARGEAEAAVRAKGFYNSLSSKSEADIKTFLETEDGATLEEVAKLLHGTKDKKELQKAVLNKLREINVSTATTHLYQLTQPGPYKGLNLHGRSGFFGKVDGLVNGYTYKNYNNDKKRHKGGRRTTKRKFEAP